MTLSIAWVRKIRDTEELVFATDSRVRGGLEWDACPKLFTFDRSDCAMAFAGHTFYAYPNIQQIRATLDAIPKVKSGAADLSYVRHVALHVLESMRSSISGRVPGITDATDINTELLLGGYSWRTDRFMLWRLFFDAAIGKFRYDSAPRKRQILFAGNSDAVKDARTRIVTLVHERGVGPHYNMEPFEVLRDICRGKLYIDIRGPVQLLKVYKHHNTMPYCIYWPTRASGTLTYLGRTLASFEDLPYFRLDPDTLQTLDSFRFEPR